MCFWGRLGKPARPAAVEVERGSFMKLTKSAYCPRCEGSGKIAVIDGEALRKHRLKKRVGLRELARRADIVPSYLSDIELGRRQPSWETLQRILKNL